MAKFYSSDLPEYQVEPESFEFVQMEGEIADEKFQDKPIGFFKDAMLRFCRSKVSIIAFIGIVIVLSLIHISWNGKGGTGPGYPQQFQKKRKTFYKAESDDPERGAGHGGAVSRRRARRDIKTG